jgi:ABC-type transport system involved in multi-copper enzyme maturation permease subunit
MTQTLAIFLDAYRDLNSRKLFWLAIAVSFLAVAICGAVGIDETGVSVLWFHIDSQFVNTTFIPAATFYKLNFQNLGINIWLTWLAAILALISTASVVPELIASGSIDMMLSKPISRARLFLTRWVTGLFFAGFQALVFVTASFLVIGIRGGVWEPELFVAVPTVVVFFSYLYCFCALMGVLTRSTVASLLLTLVFWLVLYGLQSLEQFANRGRIASEMEITAIESAIEKRLASNPEADVDRLRADLERERESGRRWQQLYWPSYAVVTALPKTNETTEWLERYLVQRASFRRPPDEESTLNFFGSKRVKRRDFQQAVFDDAEARKGALWSIGTSLAFEAAMLGGCVWLFRRRDF